MGSAQAGARGLTESAVLEETQGHETSPLVRYGDAIAVGTLLVLIGVTMGFIWRYDYWLQDWDKLAQFSSWFSHLGQSLRNGDLPAWDSSASSGQPFIGAPASGWLSIPIMLCFLIVDVITAYKVFILVHMLLGGLSTYAFCRRIGMTPYPALIGGTAYALGPMLYSAIRYEAAQGQVLMFVPLAMLGIESALRSRRLSGILGWSLFTGLMLSQMYVSSIPRVIYPTAIMAGWMAWRVVIDPVPDVGDRLAHLRKFVLIGFTLSLAFFGAAAAALLPQLDYNPQTNIAGSEYDVPGGNYTVTNFSYPYAVRMLFFDLETFGRTRLIGGGILALALVAVAGQRLRFGAIYWAAVIWALVDFTTKGSIVREVLWLIPGVEQVTHHRPMSANAFVAMPMVVLAAAGAQWLQESAIWSRQALIRLIPIPIAALGVYWLNHHGYFIGWWQLAALCAALAIILLWNPVDLRAATGWKLYQPAAARSLLLLAILLAPTIEDMSKALYDENGGDYQYQAFRRDPAASAAFEQILSRSDPGTTAGFLQDKAKLLQPFRIASWGGGDDAKQVFSGQTHPDIIDLVSNSRPMLLGLQSTYGYNPAHLQTYVDYLEVLNDREQDYHFTEILGPALNRAPLLDMLNVRYIVTRKAVMPPATTPPAIAEWGTLVYEDERMLIYENPYAYNRAWIVHDVRPAMDGEELTIINTGQVDGRQTAFVDGEIPPVSPLAQGAPADMVSISSYENEEIALRTNSSADGLLVLSEMYVEGWNAYVDGEKADILRTNHTLRSVPLPAGEHEVVLKYEPRSLTIGLWTTIATAIAMAGVWIWAGLDRRKYRNRRGKQ
jgi:hypothetical protein